MLGGVSEDDARSYAGEMRSDTATIMAAKKRSGGAEFVTYIRNHRDRGMTINVGFGTLERMDEMDGWQFDDLREHVRNKYCRSRYDMPEEDRQQPSSRPSGLNPDFELGEHEEL